MEKIAKLSLRVNPTVKESAEEVLSRLGIPMSTAIDIYLNQISLTGGIPFAATLPKSSSIINADLMTTTELHAKLQKGYDDIEAGNVHNASSAFSISDLLSYKNYNGTVEYSREDNCLFGKVIGIKSLLSYEGASVQELELDFRTAIDEYLEDCKARNVQPEQPYKGTFNVRISPELHRNIAIYAIEHGKSLNTVVEEAIESMVAGYMPVLNKNS